MAEQIVVLDESKIKQKISEFPDQLEKSWTTNWIKDIPSPEVPIKQVIICGMGGSGIAGQLVKELFYDQPVRIDTWADYGLPAWVDAHTAIIAVSYSGDTEETVDAVKAAVDKKLPVFAISTGGKLKELSEIHGFTFLEIAYESAPRSAIGWLYGSIITLLTKLKIVNFNEKMFFDALTELKSAVKQEVFPQKAEDMAISLNNKVPIIVAAIPVTAVAYRWATQLNENSKTFAIAAHLPEMCHNLLVGLDFSVPEKLSVLILESKYAFSRNVARKKIIEKIFTSKGIPAVPLSVSSNSLLAEQFLMIHFGDWLSYYLAGVYGVDPGPVEVINTLKEELKKV